jgi:hypothetical protein
MDFGSPKQWPSNFPPDAEFDFSALLDKRIILSTNRALENQEAAGDLAPSKHISELQTTAKKLNYLFIRFFGPPSAWIWSCSFI